MRPNENKKGMTKQESKKGYAFLRRRLLGEGMGADVLVYFINVRLYELCPGCSEPTDCNNIGNVTLLQH